MGTTAIPYSRFERRKAWFVIHSETETIEKESFKAMLKRIFTLKKKQPLKKVERKYCIFNKDRSNFNLIEDVNKAHVFKFDTAVELAKKVPIEGIKVSLIKNSPNGFILV